MSSPFLRLPQWAPRSHRARIQRRAFTQYAATFGAIRRFRAALADALDVAVQQLLEEIAENVLARELTVAGADVASIVAKTRERFSSERVLRVRVHPRDRSALDSLEIDSVLDETLVPGDVIAELAQWDDRFTPVCAAGERAGCMFAMMVQPRLCLGTCAFGRALDATGAPLDGGSGASRPPCVAGASFATTQRTHRDRRAAVDGSPRDRRAA